MLVQSKQLIGARIVSLHTGHVIGRLADVIINPHKLEVVGFYCATPKAAREPMVLLTQDVRQFNQGRVFVNSIDEITASSELVRLQETIKLNFSLPDKLVRTASRRKLGRVEDYVVETLGWGVQKIYVKQPLLKSFSASNLIIDRTQIVEVTDNQITVNDAHITQPAVAPQRVA